MENEQFSTLHYCEALCVALCLRLTKTARYYWFYLTLTYGTSKTSYLLEYDAIFMYLVCIYLS